MDLGMELYAVYKDGKMIKVSQEQNTPFYDNLNGAQKAMRYLIRNSYTYLPDIHKRSWQKYIDEQAKRYEIRKFILEKDGVIVDKQ